MNVRDLTGINGKLICQTVQKRIYELCLTYGY